MQDYKTQSKNATQKSSDARDILARLIKALYASDDVAGFVLRNGKLLDEALRALKK